MNRVINGVKFSPREIDILSSVINLRGSKKIANILSISHRTVERHIQNIMLKTGCHSQESIKDFIDSSDSLLFLKKHYINLLTEAFFDKQLAQIKQLKRKQEVQFNIDSSNDADVNKLKVHLTKAGLIYNPEECVNIFSFQKDNDNTLYIDPTDYFNSIFDTLEILIDGINFSKIKSEFERLKDNNDVVREDITAQINSYIQQDTHLLTLKTEIEPTIVENQNNPTKSAKHWYKSFLVLVLISVVGAVVWLKPFESRLLISSDLMIPHSTNFLDRPQQVAKLRQLIANDQNDIKIVALVGVGGSGKTVLARNFARQSNADIIWEINASSKESMIASFEDLAHALCENEKELRILTQIIEIKDETKRHRRILNFVSKKLNQVDGTLNASWLLLFDNINETFDVSQFLPSNPKLWGKGSVILTSRDQKHLVGSYIDHANIIQIEPLNMSEQQNLFTKLVGDSSNRDIASGLTKFLEQIPPYPLDISIAAYYIKERKISFADYLENIAEISDKSNKNLGDYTDTRRAIISITARNLLTSHPEFYDLMLTASMIDGHRIEHSLFALGHSENLLSEFIDNMTKHGLLYSNNNQGSSVPSYIMHETTQNTLREFLLEYKQNHREITDKILLNLFDYFVGIINNDNIEQIKLAPAHLDQISSIRASLSEISSAMLDMIYGNIYFYLSNNLEAEKYLSQGIKLFENFKTIPKEYSRQVVSAWLNLGNVYSNIGKYSESIAIINNSIKLYEKAYPDNPYYSTSAKINLARIYVKIGKYEKAQTLLKDGYQVYRSYFGDDHPETAWIMLYYGNLLVEQGQYEQAEQLIKMHIAILKNHFDAEHIRVSWGLTDLANLYIRTGRYAEAESVLEQSKLINSKYYDETSPNSSWLLHNLGLVHGKLGNLQKSLQYLNIAYSNHLEHNGNDFVTSRDLLEIAILNLEIGQIETAMEQLDNVQLSYIKHFGKKHVKVAKIYNYLARGMMIKNERDKAMEYLKKSQTMYKTRNHPEIYLAYENLSKFYKHNHNYDAAKIYIKKAEEVLRQTFPMNSEITKRVMEERKNMSNEI